jgi:hypothetical protein
VTKRPTGPDLLLAECNGGTLYACVSPGARFTEARVAERRLGAFLAPFPDESSARCALTSAGGANITKEGVR